MKPQVEPKDCPRCGRVTEAKASQIIPWDRGTVVAWRECVCGWAKDLPAGTTVMVER